MRCNALVVLFSRYGCNSEIKFKLLLLLLFRPWR